MECATCSWLLHVAVHLGMLCRSHGCYKSLVSAAHRNQVEKSIPPSVSFQCPLLMPGILRLISFLSHPLQCYTIFLGGDVFLDYFFLRLLFNIKIFYFHTIHFKYRQAHSVVCMPFKIHPHTVVNFYLFGVCETVWFHESELHKKVYSEKDHSPPCSYYPFPIPYW